MKKLAKCLSVTVAVAAVLLASVAMGQELHLSTWKGYAPKAQVDQFQQQTGIKVKITFTNNEEMIAKLRATRGGGFDLAQPSQDRIAGPQKQFKP